MGKVYKVIKTVIRTLLLVVIGVLVVYNAYILIARTLFKNGMPVTFGFACATVVSGSMADEIDVGDFIITKSQKEYAVGDVITFYDGESGAYITHRIILVSGDTYATKGDANDTADDFSVPKSAVVGKVVAVWKGFGNVVSFLQSPLGLVCVIGGGVGCVCDGYADDARRQRDGRAAAFGRHDDDVPGLVDLAAFTCTEPTFQYGQRFQARAGA